MSKEFIRKSKESKPVVAICYDFDKTLSPDDMQAQGYIQSVGDEVESFGKSQMGWLKRTTWIKIWLTCLP